METLIINSEIDEKPIKYFFRVTANEKIEFNKIMDEKPETEEMEAFKQVRENVK